MNLNAILAQATTAAGQPGQPAPPPIWQSLALPFLLVVIFYFVLIRPQQKRAKAQAALISALKSGDKVVTASGIIGTVISVKDKTVSLRSADAKMEITKSSVTEILESSTATEV